MNKSQALTAGTILGKCTVKNMGTLFLPIIQLKAEINKLSEEFSATQMQIVRDAGVEMNQFDGSIPEGTDVSVISKINTAVKELSEQPFTYDCKILEASDLSKLADENSSLTVSEITVLLELVK